MWGGDVVTVRRRHVVTAVMAAWRRGGQRRFGFRESRVRERSLIQCTVRASSRC